jgi:hypothetical protein
MPPDDRAADLILVGVFPERRAPQVADALRQTGVPEAEIRVGDPDDDVLAKRAEMQIEAGQSWFSPTVGILYPDEAAKGFAVAVVVGAVIGAVLLAPFGFIEVGGFDLWIRLLFMAAAGALAGGAIGAVVGPALASSRPGEPDAAGRGVVVRVERQNAEIERVLSEFEPIRLDRLRRADGSLDSTVTDEGERSDTGVIDDMASRARGVDTDFRDA